MYNTICIYAYISTIKELQITNKKESEVDIWKGLDQEKKEENDGIIFNNFLRKTKKTTHSCSLIITT